MNRKFTALALGSILSLGLVACSPKSDEPITMKDNTEVSQTIQEYFTNLLDEKNTSIDVLSKADKTAHQVFSEEELNQLTQSDDFRDDLNEINTSEIRNKTIKFVQSNTPPVHNDVPWKITSSEPSIIYEVRPNTGVYSIADGKVVELIDDSECGTGLIIEFNNGNEGTYCHLKKNKVEENDTVEQDEIIAASGESGDVKTPQITFELKTDDTSVKKFNYDLKKNPFINQYDMGNLDEINQVAVNFWALSFQAAFEQVDSVDIDDNAVELINDSHAELDLSKVKLSTESNNESRIGNETKIPFVKTGDEWKIDGHKISEEFDMKFAVTK